MAQTTTPIRRLRWLTPTAVALTATAVVALLLLLPIRALGPGDHQRQSCGNTLRLDLTSWRGPELEAANWEKAWRTCTP